MFLGFLATAAAQVIATADGIEHLLGWNAFFSWTAAMMLGWTPVLGTALGVYGAHVAWHWSWPATLAVFLWPVAVFALLLALSKD